MGIFNKLFSGNTLYYPGCMTKFALAKHIKHYKRILELEGIEHVMLGERELCCGSPVKNAGGEQAFRRVAKANLEVFREHGISRIISNCPACVAVFSKDYPEILGKEWDMEVLHISEVVDRAKDKLIKVKDKKATYHDPCHLGRELGIYEQPRDLIRAAGYELVEMELAGEKSFCCGGGGGVRTNQPELSDSISADRVEQAEKTSARTLITACPMCYAQLKNSAKNKLEVLDLCQLFDLR